MLTLHTYWATPEKIQTGGGGGVEDMEFLEVSKKSMSNFQGLIKNEAEFSWVNKKKQCGSSTGLCLWPWNFQAARDLT